MNKKLIRLTESDLHRIVKESVNRVLNEIGDTNRGQYHLGRAAMRRVNMGDYDDAREIDRYAAKQRGDNASMERYNLIGTKDQDKLMKGKSNKDFHRGQIQVMDDRLRTKK